MSKLEKYEWVYLWYDEADTAEGIRTLLVGDSITRGARPYVQRAVGENVHVDMIATSKALDNERYLGELMYMLGSEHYSLIRFNNGLHGFHLSAEEYERAYDRVIGRIREEYPDIPIEIGLSTPVTIKDNPSRYDEQNTAVLARNAAARRIAEKYGLKADDLYSLVDGRTELKLPDGTHYTDEGYELIGGHIAHRIMTTYLR